MHDRVGQNTPEDALLKAVGPRDLIPESVLNKRRFWAVVCNNDERIVAQQWRQQSDHTIVKTLNFGQQVAVRIVLDRAMQINDLRVGLRGRKLDLIADCLNQLQVMWTSSRDVQIGQHFVE